MDKGSIIKEISRLKKEKNAVILAHYYVEPEVQDIADYIGDSLGLSQMAGQTDADIIIFCGVSFMAETASIISPDKRVFVPDISAGCSLADSIKAEDIIRWRENNPGGIVVSYVNSTAEVKANTDICCTSANAMQVILSIPENKKIFFVPDKNLASYVKIMSGRDIDIWEGDCCVHEYFDTKVLQEVIKLHPDAEILVHPESSSSHDPAIYELENAYILSTTGMVKRAKISDAKKFIVATEPGVIYQMQRLAPDKVFIAVEPYNKCYQMRKVTLEKVLASLREERYEIKVPEDIQIKALPSIERMLRILGA
ncbi:MAG: quinolinate synthase NadA [Bacteroidales bacterium]|nr:quinolinate synthase NadA [Bacteroidales bacterium]